MKNIHNKSRHYFGAANTSDGFKSYFDDIFHKNHLDKLYILKGGPGVGKSTLMKKAAKESENKGMTVEYYRCSSDPDSLDGIIIKDIRTAIVDGTSPHTMDASLAGAYEEIIDLGKAWDVDALFKKRNELQKLSDRKKECYNKAYSLLYACKKIKELNLHLVEPFILKGKMNTCCERLLKSILTKSCNQAEKEKTRLVNAVSCKGKIHLCTFEDDAKLCVFIKEHPCHKGLAERFITLLYSLACKKGTELIVSLSPLDTSKVDGLFFAKEKICVVPYCEELVEMCDKSGKKCRIINTNRFLNTKDIQNVKKECRLYSKLASILEDDALKSLEKAGEIHFALEDIYSSCTDYSKVEEIGSEYLSRITRHKKRYQ